MIMRQPVALLCAAAGVVSSTLAPPCESQPTRSVREAHPLTAVANLEASAVMPSDSIIELTLNRPLASDEGDLVLMVGDVDVTAVSQRTARGIIYRAAALARSAGETEVVLFKRIAGRWDEIKRLSIRVLQGKGGTRFSADRSATVGNKGQIAEGRSPGVPAPARRTFQDFVLNAGLHSSHEGTGWGFTTQSNYVGVTRREDALRFGVRGDRAPMFDLSDYSIGLRASALTLSLGRVSFGTSRHLANGLAARGSTVVLANGPTTLTLGALSGSSQVGWDDLLGIEQPTNRIVGASIGHELVRARPGALRIDLTYLDGSKRPLSSFTQSAIVDAEESSGGSVQLTGALPNQRLRFTGGFTRSRFENPARDPELLGSSVTRRPRPETRDARFVEATLVVLQNARILRGPSANFTLGVRDERVDPLFRSIAAPAGADRQQDAVDATISLGAITAQLSQSLNRDNLGRLATALTTVGHTSTASVAVPTAQLFGVRSHTSLFPLFTVSLNRIHQFADGLPPAGSFRPGDLPDQLNSIGDVAAQWQIGRVRASIRSNLVNQDNRQEQRESADFASGVRAVSLGVALGNRGDISIDGGDEFQTAKERNETTRVRRATLNGTYRPHATTNLVVGVSLLRTRQPTSLSTTNTEQHLELSQSFLLPGASEAQRGQFFLRYARTASLLPDLTGLGGVNPPLVHNQQWTLASGLNVRLF